MTTSPLRSRKPATAFAACLLRPIRRSSLFSDRALTIRRRSICLSATRPRAHLLLPARFLEPSSAQEAHSSPICPEWPCVASLICTSAKLRNGFKKAPWGC